MKKINRIPFSQEELKDIVYYDAVSGNIWRKYSNYYKKAGSYNDSGYLTIMIGGINYRSHRLAMLYMLGDAFNQELEVDHDNQIRDDNRFENLNLVTAQENLMNLSLKSNNTSGCIGVFYRKDTSKWIVRISNITYGNYVEKQDAIDKSKQVYKELGFHENHGS